MKILFICKYNRFRSRVAEAYFKKINKKIKSSSAGLIKGNPTPSNTKNIAKKLGLNLNGHPRATSTKLLESQDLIIITANDVQKSIFKNYSKKIIVWKIQDSPSKNSKKIEKIIRQIIKRVDNLNKQLNTTK